MIVPSFQSPFYLSGQSVMLTASRGRAVCPPCHSPAGQLSAGVRVWQLSEPELWIDLFSLEIKRRLKRLVLRTFKKSRHKLSKIRKIISLLKIGLMNEDENGGLWAKSEKWVVRHICNIANIVTLPGSDTLLLPSLIADSGCLSLGWTARLSQPEASIVGPVTNRRARSSDQRVEVFIQYRSSTTRCLFRIKSPGKYFKQVNVATRYEIW